MAAPPPTAEQLATREHRVRLVAEDVDTGERVVLAERVPWRSLEVLGAAAKYYATPVSYTHLTLPTKRIV